MTHWNQLRASLDIVYVSSPLVPEWTPLSSKETWRTLVYHSACHQRPDVWLYSWISAVHVDSYLQSVQRCIKHTHKEHTTTPRFNVHLQFTKYIFDAFTLNIDEWCLSKIITIVLSLFIKLNWSGLCWWCKISLAYARKGAINLSSVALNKGSLEHLWTLRSKIWHNMKNKL